jgi:hypothetical protein
MQCRSALCDLWPDGHGDGRRRHARLRRRRRHDGAATVELPATGQFCALGRDLIEARNKF